jgi:hypothetical protein
MENTIKVTALISESLLNEVKRISGAKNITESLVTALTFYVNNQKLYKVLDELDSAPLEFREDFTAYQVRKQNRDR